MYNFTKVPSGKSMEQEHSLGTLGQFINDQIRSRKISMREFADLVGVSHATISRLVNKADPPMPTLDVLAKLASATNTDPCALFGLIYPDLVITLDPESQILASQIGKMPDDAKDVIKTLVVNTVLKHTQDTP